MKHEILGAAKALGVFSLILQLTACSVTAGSDGAPPPPPVVNDRFSGKPRIAGPAIEGIWKSACVKYAYESRIWTLTFTGENFARSQQTFSDANCIASSGRYDATGSFIFSNAYSDGTFEINYAIDLDGTWFQRRDEKISLSSDTLYVSNFMPGDTAPLVYSMPMKKQAAFMGDAQ